MYLYFLGEINQLIKFFCYLFNQVEVLSILFTSVMFFFDNSKQLKEIKKLQEPREPTRVKRQKAIIKKMQTLMANSHGKSINQMSNFPSKILPSFVNLIH